MKNTLLPLILLIFIASSCSMFATAPNDIVTGKDTVCILYDSTGFREAVVQNMVRELKTAKFNVVLDTTKRAKFYQAKDYAAVIHISEYRAWHVPFHAKRYFKSNGRADNMVFVVTSGDPDVKITKPFDAVTGASRENNVGRFSREILDKLRPLIQ